MQRLGFLAVFGLALLSVTSICHAMNCVAFARTTTGFSLAGDAWRWWDTADGVYSRGHVPKAAAVLVFARTKNMPHGHVAVVRAVKGAREILIDQANWGTGHHKGAVDKSVSVIDVSADNDWSSVRVQYGKTAEYGRVNQVRGFIYPSAPSLQKPIRTAYYSTGKH